MSNYASSEYGNVFIQRNSDVLQNYFNVCIKNTHQSVICNELESYSLTCNSNSFTNYYLQSLQIIIYNSLHNIIIKESNYSWAQTAA